MTGPQGACLLAPVRFGAANWKRAVEVDVQPVHREPLTRRQEQIVAFIDAYLAEFGYPPTLREIASGVGLKSTSSVKYQAEELAAKGWLVLPGVRAQTRALRLVRPGEVG